jgi:hypothetical protein
MAKSSKPTELNVPPAFSGTGQLLLYTRYGDPRETGFEPKWMMLWDIRKAFPWFPKRSIYIHKHFRPMLEAAFHELVLTNLHEEIKTYDGCFNIRMVRGSRSVLSTHAWGAAIDLNARENPLGSAGKWSPQFITVMEKHEVCCGQSWKGRKDPMHFAMVDG